MEAGWEAKYFRKRGLDGRNQIESLVKISIWVRCDFQRICSSIHAGSSAIRLICPPGSNPLAPIQDHFPLFSDLLTGEPVNLFDRLRAAESIGRPLGDDRFLSRIKRLTGRDLKPGKRGPKPLDREKR